MLDRLYKSAVAIGETPVRMVQNFTQALDVMAQYSGPRAMQVLQGLSAIAKTTGIEMNRLTSIAMQFDTFESAATNVAKLNAILGGAYYNSVQMLNATESQRLHLLRAGLDATNRSWQSLGRWEKKAFAAAAGMKDMNVAAAFFTGNMAKVEELTRLQEEQAETQMRLVQAAGSVVSIFQQIKRIFQDAGFVAKDLLGFIRGVVGVMKTLGFEGLIAVKAIWAISNSLMAAKIQAAAFASATGQAASGVTLLSTAARGIVPLLAAAGLAYAMFADKFRQKGSAAAVHLPGIAARGLSAMGPAAEEAAKGLGSVQNKLGTLSDKKLVGLSRTLAMVSQVSSPNLNFGKVTNEVVDLTRAVNTLDEKKINSFSNAMGRLGATMTAIPKENVVAVTQLTKESRMISALPVAAAARSAGQIAAQGSAVRQARASEAPRGGGTRGGQEGILVTDSISVNVGGTVLTQRIQDTVRGTLSKYERRTG
jgi:hypothetical protein